LAFLHLIYKKNGFATGIMERGSEIKKEIRKKITKEIIKVRVAMSKGIPVYPMFLG